MLQREELPKTHMKKIQKTRIACETLGLADLGLIEPSFQMVEKKKERHRFSLILPAEIEMNGTTGVERSSSGFKVLPNRENRLSLQQQLPPKMISSPASSSSLTKDEHQHFHSIDKKGILTSFNFLKVSEIERNIQSRLKMIEKASFLSKTGSSMLGKRKQEKEAKVLIESAHEEILALLLELLKFLVFFFLTMLASLP
jgi:hypothetical protein